MVESNETDIFLINSGAIVVIVEVVGAVDTAADRTVLKLSLHLVCSSDGIHLRDVVTSIGDSFAVFTLLALSGRRPRAVTANIDILANAIHIVKSLVVHARGVDETIGHGELVDLSGVTTVARSASLAVDDHLGADSDWRGSRHVVKNVESIGKGRGCTL